MTVISRDICLMVLELLGLDDFVVDDSDHVFADLIILKDFNEISHGDFQVLLVLLLRQLLIGVQSCLRLRVESL